MYLIADLPRNNAICVPNKKGIVFEGKSWTWKEFDQRINKMANALLALGMKKGKGVAVMADNCSKYLEAYFAAAKIGMRVTPINIRLGNDEIVYIVNDSEVEAFVVGDGYEEKVLNLKSRFLNIKVWITFDNPLDGFYDYEQLLEDSSDIEPDFEEMNVQEDDMAILMYTGGTTGAPKGVMLSHRNVMASAAVSALYYEFTQDDATCFVLPIFHVSWWTIPAMMLVGGKICINRRPGLESIYKLIESERCTHLQSVPTLYNWMVDDPNMDKYDLSSLKVTTYSGSPMPLELVKKCMKKLGTKFGQGYGMTESAAGPVTRLNYRDHHLEGPQSKYLISAGKPAWSSRVKIVDADDKTLGPGEIGEVCCKSKTIMLGYWKNPDLTAHTMRGGWYHTGDMGYMDEDYYLFLTDRKADMIVTGGENVYPKEVENVIYQLPAVKECSVVSKPDAKWGEAVQAVIVLKPGQKLTEEEVIGHCKKALAGYKCPKAVAFWDELPKTVVGKIVKKDIKKSFWEGKDRMVN